MLGLGVGEIVLILGLLVLLFGAKKIPQIAKGLGEGIRNFRSSIKEGSEDPDRLEDESDEIRRLDDGQNR
jgi:sec-independent protein translocase protein TatA